MSEPRIAVCSWSLQPRNPADLIEKIAQTDITAVQLDLTHMLTNPKMWWPAMSMLPEAGVEVVSGMMAMEGEDYSTLESIALTGGVRRDETWPVNCTRAEMVAELADEMGLSLVTFHAGFIPEEADDPERATLVERLQALADGFANRGLGIAFETGQETAETLALALQAIDRPNVGVNFDPANMILYGKGDPVAALEHLSPWVVQVHIKDAVPTEVAGTWGREVPVGEGAVDWTSFLAAVGAIDPSVDLVIEREAGGERLEDVRRARDLVLAEFPSVPQR